jgi:hypothetical protein
MKKELFIFAVALFVSTIQCFAFGLQETNQPDSLTYFDPAYSDNSTKQFRAIWLNVGQLGNREIQLGFEKQTNATVSVTGTLGFKIPTKTGQLYNLNIRSIGPEHYYDYIAWIPYSTGLMADLAVKKYLNELPGWYLSGAFFYRYWFFNHQKLSSGEMVQDTRDTFTSDMTLKMHVSGFKLLMGKTFTLTKLTGDKSLFGDFYYGLGYRKKLVHADFESFDKSYYSGPYPAFTRSESISLQLGFKVGFRF